MCRFIALFDNEAKSERESTGKLGFRKRKELDISFIFYLSSRSFNITLVFEYVACLCVQQQYNSPTHAVMRRRQTATKLPVTACGELSCRLHVFPVLSLDGVGGPFRVLNA
jgi:hypothetical protein